MGTPAGVNKDRVYLNRNMTRLPGGSPSDALLAESLSAVRMHNGLECKISCSNSKVRFLACVGRGVWSGGLSACC